MITVEQAANRWKCSGQRVRQWLADGRIKGAERFGGMWAIPDVAKRPTPVGSPNGGPAPSEEKS